jgi:hypothetical protein
LSFATLGAFAWNEPSQWAPQRFDEYPVRLFFSDWFTPMVLIGWFLLIVRVVQEEVLASDRQFWVTRPYDWKKLLTAKVLFLVVFVNLPLFILQMILLSKAGFRPTEYLAGLLYLQLLWILTLILPLITLATITSSLVQAMLATIGILLGMIAVAALFSVHAIQRLTVASWIPVWLPSTIKVCAYAVIVFVLVWQYARRRTQQSRLLLIAAAAAVLIVPSPPDTFSKSEYPQTPAWTTAAGAIRVRSCQAEGGGYPAEEKQGDSPNTFAGFRNSTVLDRRHRWNHGRNRSPGRNALELRLV